MRCHYCGQAADVEIESEGVIVGLCEFHLRERVEALADDDALADLLDVLDIEET